MKFFILSIFLGYFLNAGAQVVRGTVTDVQTKEPLPYVNIGVKGKNLGVISNASGEYNINLSGLSENDSLTFSMIGHQTAAYAIRSVLGNPEIKLYRKEYLLREVVISNTKNQVPVKLGRYVNNKTTFGHSGREEFGHGGELGIRIVYPGKPYGLKNISFHLRFNTVDSILFRVNVYDLKNGYPSKPMLSKEQYVTSRKNENWIVKDLLNENLFITSDIVVSYELIRIWYNPSSQNHIFFSYGTGYNEGKSFSRESSQDAWKIDARPGMAIFVTGLYDQ